MGCTGWSEASSKYWGDTLPASTPGHCTHWPKGCVFREGFLGYLYSHFIYNPNSKTEKINHMVDKFM